jgi:hypothetical protein
MVVVMVVDVGFPAPVAQVPFGPKALRLACHAGAAREIFMRIA